jgi:hypothetical protein
VPADRQVFHTSSLRIPNPPTITLDADNDVKIGTPQRGEQCYIGQNSGQVMVSTGPGHFIRFSIVGIGRGAGEYLMREIMLFQRPRERHGRCFETCMGKRRIDHGERQIG